MHHFGVFVLVFYFVNSNEYVNAAMSTKAPILSGSLQQWSEVTASMIPVLYCQASKVIELLGNEARTLNHITLLTS